MSVWAKKWAYERRVGNPGAKSVLVALAEFANEDGFCYPSQRTLAAMTEIKERTVRAHLAFLEDRKLIARETRRGTEGRWTSDGHRLLAPPEQLRPPAPPPEPEDDEEEEADQRQNLPAAKSAARPAAESDSSQRQNLPAAKSAAKPLIESDEPSGEPKDSLSSERAREAINAYEQVYGHVPHIDGQTEIEAVTRSPGFDLALWRDTLRQCKGNRTPDKNVGTMLKMYGEQKARADADGERRRALGHKPLAAPVTTETQEQQQARLRDEYYGRNRQPSAR